MWKYVNSFKYKIICELTLGNDNQREEIRSYIEKTQRIKSLKEIEEVGSIYKTIVSLFFDSMHNNP